MLADHQGFPSCLCPGTSQVQESMCRSQKPGQNAANISSWEKSCGTHPTGWERPQASTETLWLKANGSFSFFVALESSCRRHSGGREERLLLAFLQNSVLVFLVHPAPSRWGRSLHPPPMVSRNPCVPHLFTHILSPAHPWPCRGHWCKWGLICPRADESAGTFLC